jgi:hypothetical protein
MSPLTEALQSQIHDAFASMGAVVTFGPGSVRAWASAAFSGEFHHIALTAPAGAVTAFVNGLEDREFVLEGQIVADIEATVTRPGRSADPRLTLTALIIETNEAQAGLRGA